MALCLYNNEIQLAKLKVYKVTVLNHEKYIICYDRNYFKTNVHVINNRLDETCRDALLVQMHYKFNAVLQLQCIAAISSSIYAIVKLWTVTEFMHETHYFSHFEVMFRVCTNFLVLHFMNFRFTVIAFF